MGFKAAEVAETLDYDFSPFCDAKGEIPEPSAEQVNTFNARYVALLAALGRYQTNRQRRAADPTTEESEERTLMQELDAMEVDSQELSPEMTRIDTEQRQLVADVCSNKPSFEELQQLPSRQFRAFLAWLYEELSDPKKLRPGTNSIPAALRAE